MAESDPEGQAWFERSALRCQKPYPWTADNAEQFYSHFLVEVVINDPVRRAWSSSDVELPYDPDKPFMDRAGKQAWYPPAHDAMTRYWWWTVFVGDDNGNISRGFPFHHWPDFWKHRDTARVGYIPLPMPKLDDDDDSESHIYFDLTTPIRRLLFPLCHSKEKGLEHMCSYASISFNKRNSIFIQDGEGEAISFPRDKLRGLGHSSHYTVKVDWKPLMIFLGIPRQNRDTTINPFEEFFGLVYGQELYPHYVDHWFHETNRWTAPDHIVDIVDVINSSQGLSLQYAPGDDAQLQEILENFVSAGLGLIPAVGPFLVVGFHLIDAYVKDPEAFGDMDLFKNSPDLASALVSDTRIQKVLLKFLRR